MHHSNLSELIKRAITEGARQTSTTRWEWNVAGNCSAPVMVEHHARAPRSRYGKNDAQIVVGKHASKNSLWLIMETRCRKCSSCRKHRQAQWTAKAMTEYGRASRTWFGTLTLSPQSRFLLLSRARVKDKSLDFDRLDNNQRYAAYWSEVSTDLTKYVKRVRKSAGSPFRIFIVGEAHKDYTPHVHFLFFEQQEGTLMKDHIRKNWTHGFSQVKLVHDYRGVIYVAKYLGKTAQARIRASIRFGREPKSVEDAVSTRIPPLW